MNAPVIAIYWNIYVAAFKVQTKQFIYALVNNSKSNYSLIHCEFSEIKKNAQNVHYFSFFKKSAIDKSNCEATEQSGNRIFKSINFNIFVSMSYLQFQ